MFCFGSFKKKCQGMTYCMPKKTCPSLFSKTSWTYMNNRCSYHFKLLNDTQSEVRIRIQILLDRIRFNIVSFVLQYFSIFCSEKVIIFSLIKFWYLCQPRNRWESVFDLCMAFVEIRENIYMFSLVEIDSSREFVMKYIAKNYILSSIDKKWF